jgi:hypothetical protein
VRSFLSPISKTEKEITTTAASGRYRINGIPGAMYDITISARGYDAEQLRRGDVRRDRHHERIVRDRDDEHERRSADDRPQQRVLARLELCALLDGHPVGPLGVNRNPACRGSLTLRLVEDQPALSVSDGLL